MTLSRWTSKRLFLATAAVFVTGLVVFYSQGLFSTLPVEQAAPALMIMGATARLLFLLSIVLGVLGGARKGQEG